MQCYLQKVEFLDDPVLEDFGVKLSTILYRNFLLDRSIMCQPNNYLVNCKLTNIIIYILCYFNLLLQITTLPAKPTIYEFLSDFTNKKNA